MGAPDCLVGVRYRSLSITATLEYERRFPGVKCIEVIVGARPRDLSCLIDLALCLDN